MLCFAHQQTAAVGYELIWRKKWRFSSVEHHLLGVEIHQYDRGEQTLGRLTPESSPWFRSQYSSAVCQPG